MSSSLPTSVPLARALAPSHPDNRTKARKHAGLTRPGYHIAKAHRDKTSDAWLAAVELRCRSAERPHKPAKEKPKGRRGRRNIQHRPWGAPGVRKNLQAVRCTRKNLSPNAAVRPRSSSTPVAPESGTGTTSSGVKFWFAAGARVDS